MVERILGPFFFGNIQRVILLFVINQCIKLHLYQIGQYNVCVLCIKGKTSSNGNF